jgi:hypothetical protein
MPAYDVSFFKYVDVRDYVNVDKEFDIDAYVKGNSAMANATADALGKNTHTETLTQTAVVQGEYSGSVSESISATSGWHFNHNVA